MKLRFDADRIELKYPKYGEFTLEHLMLYNESELIEATKNSILLGPELLARALLHKDIKTGKISIIPPQKITGQTGRPKFIFSVVTEPIPTL
jgi:hypothetical protein